MASSRPPASAPMAPRSTGPSPPAAGREPRAPASPEKGPQKKTGRRGPFPVALSSSSYVGCQLHVRFSRTRLMRGRQPLEPVPSAPLCIARGGPLLRPLPPDARKPRPTRGFRSADPARRQISKRSSPPPCGEPRHPAGGFPGRRGTTGENGKTCGRDDPADTPVGRIVREHSPSRWPPPWGAPFPHL